jgi:tRNA (cytidine/uridine-2'-O-)-methyltransferase
MKSAFPGMPERHVVLVSPEIHWNTGNIGRTCLGTGSHLHLIHPLGFSLESKEVKRAGLDYWPNVSLHIWNNFDHFAAVQKPLNPEVFLFSKNGERSFWSMKPSPRMFLVFGAETRGLPDSLLEQYQFQIFSIPTNREIRSLNLSTAVGIALYESIRKAAKK